MTGAGDETPEWVQLSAEPRREDDILFVELAPEGRRRRQALVVTDSGVVKAYLNLCRHLPVPLDALRGDVACSQPDLLECRTHGAKFRKRDGHCIEGPCEGLALFSLPIEVREDGVFLLDTWPEKSGS